MAKQTFTTGQVLTAAQMTSLQQTAMGGGSATAKTASYTLVAADAGTTVIMNSGSATTITVNTGLFAAGDTVFIVNQGAGVCTITAGTATVTTAGSLAMGANETGQLYFLSASAAIFSEYTQSAAASGALTLVKSQTIGSAVSSVTVTDAFSSTYDNYVISISGGSASASGGLKLQLGSTVTGYYTWLLYGSYTGTAVNGFNQNNTTFAGDFGYTSANGHTGVANILSPNLAARTSWNMAFAAQDTTYYAGWVNGFVNNATQYTAFTLTTGSGTITGGTIRVYGYQNS
jgi:hypothetical protein